MSKQDTDIVERLRDLRRSSQVSHATANELFTEAAAEIERLRGPRAEPQEAWLPIETAPKDGSIVIAFNDSADSVERWREPTVVQWRDDERCYCLVSNGYRGTPRKPFCQPTIWQPLPAPPGTPPAAIGSRPEEALDRYRYAVEWVASDSWDHCGECRERLEWARSLDTRRLTADEIAAVGKQYLAAAGPTSQQPQEDTRKGHSARPRPPSSSGEQPEEVVERIAGAPERLKNIAFVLESTNYPSQASELRAMAKTIEEISIKPTPTNNKAHFTPSREITPSAQADTTREQCAKVAETDWRRPKGSRATCSWGLRQRWGKEIAAIIRALPAEPDAWRPIESAPKGDNDILVLRPDGSIRLAYWNRRGGDWATTPGAWQTLATHWQPLPSPPAEPAEKG